MFVALCLFEENIWSVEEKKKREGKKENIWRRKISVPWRRVKTEKENEEFFLGKIFFPRRRRSTEKENI